MLFRFKTLQKFSEKGEHWAAVPGFKGDVRFSTNRRCVLLDGKNRIKKVFKIKEKPNGEKYYQFRLEGATYILQVEDVRRELFPSIVAAEEAEAKAEAARQARKDAHGGLAPFQSVPLQCVDDGKVYNSISAAADAYGTTRHKLSAALKGNNGYVPGIDKTFRKIT